ncbi:GNAT family N-acetyltransferase [Streptomyces sp. H27-S2]|uniref:GNAT family N-acetyltransferase n=1 Tax=Streptomyces antarcticus TaxID=2996458 RepID=UPI002270F9E0|nr:GNAT family N-acetyltransferase [Streptomyces sp. H27-S2]MCY0954280.1 GNAT family N-acetyltransferase [Streptomyces sp. H27-S2]
MPERTGTLRRPGEFREVYHQVYREPPYCEDEAAADGFAAQLAEHAALPGFSVTTVHAASGALAGFAYGVRRDRGWWHPRAASPPPRDLRGPLFYVYELAVVRELRGLGHGRALLDLLLADRTEPFAVLAASTGAPAHARYLRWGWTGAGRLTGPPDGVDILARPLPPPPPPPEIRQAPPAP